MSQAYHAICFAFTFCPLGCFAHLRMIFAGDLFFRICFRTKSPIFCVDFFMWHSSRWYIALRLWWTDNQPNSIQIWNGYCITLRLICVINFVDTRVSHTWRVEWINSSNLLGERTAAHTARYYSAVQKKVYPGEIWTGAPPELSLPIPIICVSPETRGISRKVYNVLGRTLW